MALRNIILTAAAVGGISAFAATVQVRAGGDLVAFPEGFEKWVLYHTLDRADNKQHRELYINQVALDGLKTGKETPSGTVIIMVQWAAKLDEQKNPVKDANGRFVKDRIVGYTVMEKRAGWGKEYPDDIRNGEWEYQAFTPDKKINAKANLVNCFKCHKPLDKADFLFTYEQVLKAAGR
jgi:hypothetical protein